jgi:hypothetical protein
VFLMPARLGHENIFRIAIAEVSDAAAKERRRAAMA